MIFDSNTSVLGVILGIIFGTSACAAKDPKSPTSPTVVLPAKNTVTSKNSVFASQIVDPNVASNGWFATGQMEESPFTNQSHFPVGEATTLAQQPIAALEPMQLELDFVPQANVTAAQNSSPSAQMGTLALRVREKTHRAVFVAAESAPVEFGYFQSMLAGIGKQPKSLRMQGLVSLGDYCQAEWLVSVSPLTSSAAQASSLPQFKPQEFHILANLVKIECDNKTKPLGNLNFSAKVTYNPTEARTVSVGTYNVENLWDDSATVGVHYDDFKPESSNWYTDYTIDKKVRQVTKAIALAGAPDVLALQEIESAENSSRSLELIKPELTKLGYKYFALGQQSSSNPVVVTTAVISKYPITLNDSLDFNYYEEPSPKNQLTQEEADELRNSARDPQVTQIDVLGRTLRFYSSHWKSRRNGGSAGNRMRLAIAQLIKADIDAQRQRNINLDIVVTGDFNTDYFDDAVVNGLKSTGDESAMLTPGKSEALYNLWFELPEDKRCSYAHGGELTCIDNMLVADSLYDNQGLQIVDNSFRVVGHNGYARTQLLNADAAPLRWQIYYTFKGKTKFAMHQGVGFSDHLPLVTDFKLLPAQVAELHKVALSNPSASGTMPKENRQQHAESCKQSGGFRDATNVTLTAVALGTCLEFHNLQAPIKKTDLNTTVQLNGVNIRIAGIQEFASQKAWTQSLKGMVGNSRVTFVKGRLGLSYGVLTLYIEDESSDIGFTR